MSNAHLSATSPYPVYPESNAMISPLPFACMLSEDPVTDLDSHKSSSETAARRTAFLVQVQPTPEGEAVRHRLGGSPVTLGRGDGCDIRIDDGGVSRRHARIATRGDRFYIYDLQSTNGTCVNEEPALVRLLEHGDHLRLGDHVYRFVCEE
jgi:hypothetical protein